MKKLASLLDLIACSHISAAASPASEEPQRPPDSLRSRPPVDPPPKVTISDALRIGTTFAARKRPDIAQFHVDRVWLAYTARNNKRCWIISFASPKLLYYFVVVYMDGRAAPLPKGKTYPPDP